MDGRGVIPGALSNIPPLSSNRNPSEQPPLTGAASGLFGAINITIGGLGIEELFRRHPQQSKPGHVFRTFSEAEWKECFTLVQAHPRFKQVDSDGNLIKALTAVPPEFSPTNISPDRHYYSRFSEASAALGRQMIDQVIERLPSDYHVVVCPIWRAGLAFVGDPSPRISSFWHVGAVRDPVTLTSSLYYSSELGIKEPDKTALLVVDPMVGTANAMTDVVTKLLHAAGPRFPQENLHVLGMFVAPEGGLRFLSRFPHANFYAASIDNFLNERGWVIPRDSSAFLGDFGDCFAREGLSHSALEGLYRKGVFADSDRDALFRRLAN